MPLLSNSLTTTTTATTTVITMSEEGYPVSIWERSDSDQLPPHNAYPNMPPATQYQSRESLEANSGVPPTPSRTTSPPRISIDSPQRSNNIRRRDSAAPAATPVSIHPPDDDGVLESSFEENVLRALCDLDVSIVIPQHILVYKRLHLLSSAVFRYFLTE